MASVEQRKQADMHEKERELQEKVTAATVEQLRHKFNQDIETLKSRVQGREEVAMEAAKDARYLSQRQARLSHFAVICGLTFYIFHFVTLVY